MLGTLVFPKGKYATLKAASGHVLCEDVFETMVSELRTGSGSAIQRWQTLPPII